MGFPHQGEFAVHSVGVIHLGNGGGEVVFASQQNVFGTAGEVSFVLLGEGGSNVLISIQFSLLGRSGVI